MGGREVARVSKFKKEKVLILDSDSSVYAVGFMTQKKTHMALDDNKIMFQSEDKREYNEWVKENDPAGVYTYDYTENIEPVRNALASCKKFVNNTLEFTGCDRAVILLTKGGDCFRHHMATILKYKGNRDKLTKPHHYDAIRDYYMTYYDAKMYAKWEADDAACMALHKGSGVQGVEYVLAAIDKDLEQMPGKHVNPSKKDEGVYVLSEKEGWYNFYIQMLMGDVADNIQGLKGVGAKTAHKILARADMNIAMMCQIVYGEYVIKYGPDPFAYVPWWADEEVNPTNEFADRPRTMTGTALSMFRENANLLYMLRTPDDQYLPHTAHLLELWDKYPEGTVEQFLPTIEVDEDETQSP